MTEERKRYTFRLPNELYEELEEQATKQGISVNALILRILWEWEEAGRKKSMSEQRCNNGRDKERKN